MELHLHADDLIAAMVPVTYFAMVGIERLGTGWRWPAMPWWQTIGVLCFVMLAAINGFIAGALKKLCGGFHLFDCSPLGVIPGALLAYLLVSIGNAVLHRAYHRSEWLWRHVHQLHHAPQRMDVAGVMLQTPFEMAANAVLFVSVTVFLLGLDPVASMLCAYIASFYGMFQHFNIRTPRWLGYFIQRPEAHCEHHRRGVHAWNYSDVPLWDILWGTFLNPASFAGELGFEHAPPRNWWAMVLGRDVNEATLGSKSRGSATPPTNPA